MFSLAFSACCPPPPAVAVHKSAGHSALRKNGGKRSFRRNRPRLSSTLEKSCGVRKQACWRDGGGEHFTALQKSYGLAEGAMFPKRASRFREGRSVEVQANEGELASREQMRDLGSYRMSGNKRALIEPDRTPRRYGDFPAMPETPKDYIYETSAASGAGAVRANASTRGGESIRLTRLEREEYAAAVKIQSLDVQTGKKGIARPKDSPRARAKAGATTAATRRAGEKTVKAGFSQKKKSEGVRTKRQR